MTELLEQAIAKLEVEKILSISCSPQSRFKSWNIESLDENSPAI
jgi:hypothetical protein